jgi:hypothetical protein
MKKQILAVMLFAAIFITGRAAGQTPEKVYSLVKEVRTFEWYQAQSAAWQKVLEKDPANAQAWLYYFTANRMARITDRARWEKGAGKWFKDPGEIVSQAGKAVPESFEYAYIKVWNSGGEVANFEKDLMRAYELGRGRPEILDEMVLYYETTGDAAKRKEMSERWFRSNDIPAGILNYNYNVMQTLDEDAVIVTGGDNDTFPLWVLQDALGVKPRVKVLNLHLLAKKDYRDRAFRELGIPVIKFRGEDSTNPDTLFTLRQSMLSHLTEKSKRPVYLALTLDSRYYLDARMQQDLYLTGLAMCYQEKTFDNLGVIRRHFEQDYLLDYLLVSFGEDPSASVIAQMNTGYLPSLVKLCSHYRASGETEKLAKVQKMIAGIAAKAGETGMMTEMKEYLNCE